MAGVKSGAVLIWAALIVTGLSGCGGGSQDQVPLESLTAEQIYKQGELALETGAKPEKAIRYFSEV